MSNNFYNYKGINQNLTFDIVYNNYQAMLDAEPDSVFPKRLAIISYGIGEDYNTNAEIDKENHNGKTYDSTVWQKQIDGSYLPIADLDSVTIEIDTLDLKGQDGVLLGLDPEKQATPISLGINSFLKTEDVSGYSSIKIGTLLVIEYKKLSKAVLQELCDAGELTLIAISDTENQYRVNEGYEYSDIQNKILADERFYVYIDDGDNKKIFTGIEYNSAYHCFKLSDFSEDNNYYVKEKTQLVLNHKENYNSNMVASNNTTINFQNVDIEESHITNSTKHSIVVNEPITINNVEGKYTIGHAAAPISGTAMKTTAPTLSGIGNSVQMTFPNLGFDNKGHCINTATATNISFNFNPSGNDIAINKNNNNINFSHANATFNTSAVQPSISNTTVSIPKLSFTPTGHINLNDRSDLTVTFSGSNYITTSGNNGTITIEHANYTAGNSSGKMEFNSNAGSIEFTFPTVSRDSGGHVNRFDTYGTSLYVDNSQILLSANDAGKPVIQHKNDYQEYSYDTQNSGWSSIEESNEDPENIESVLVIPIPRFKINNYGHVEKVDNNWHNAPYIYSDGVICFNNNTPNNEGRICHREALTSDEVDPSQVKIIVTSKFSSTTDGVNLVITSNRYDKWGHVTDSERMFINTFIGDNSITISSSDTSIINFNHNLYNYEESENNLIVPNNLQMQSKEEKVTIVGKYIGDAPEIQKYQFEFYKEILTEYGYHDPGASVSYKVYYKDDDTKTGLKGVVKNSTSYPGNRTQYTLQYTEENYPNRPLILEISTYTGQGSVPSRATGYINTPSILAINNFKFNKEGHFRQSDELDQTLLQLDPLYFSVSSIEGFTKDMTISLSDGLISKLTDLDITLSKMQELESRISTLENHILA